MIDIVGIGNDLRLFDTDIERAKNILSVQLGSLEYAAELGIDLKYFLDEAFRFQNESFKSYTIQILANFGVNVSTIQEITETFSKTFVYNVNPSETTTALIAR